MTPPRRRVPPWVLPVGIAAAGLAYRLLYLAEQGATSPLFHQPMLDEAEALEAARALLAGEGLGDGPLFKAPLHAVLMAAFIAVSGEAWPWTMRLAQHALGALLSLLGFDAARRLAGPGRRGVVAGAIAALVLAFHAPLVRLESQLVLDTWSVALQSAMLWALVRLGGRRRAGWALLAGLLAALAWLTRPTLTPVLPLLAWWIIGWRAHRAPAARWRAALVFLAPVIVAAGLVGARNAAAGTIMILPWQGGYNLFEANRPGASGRYLRQDRLAAGGEANPTRRLALDGYLDAVALGEAAPPPPGQLEKAANAWWSRRAREAIAADPLRWLGLMGRKAIYLSSEREIFNFEDYGVQKALSPLLARNPLGFGIVWPLALASLAALGLATRGRRRLHALCWIYALALGAAIALYYTSGRMRAPLVFPVVVLGAAGLATIARARDARRIVVWIALALVGVAMSWGDWWGVRSEVTAHAEYERLSNAAWRVGRHEEALAFALRIEEFQPGYPTAPLLRAQALFGLGEIDAAESEFRAAAASLPHDPTAPSNLGAILWADDARWREAEPWLREALRRDASFAPARARLAMLLARQGQQDEAARLLAGTEPDAAITWVARGVVAEAQGDEAGLREARRALWQEGGEQALEWLEEEVNRRTQMNAD